MAPEGGRRRRSRAGATPAIGSLLVHAALVALALGTAAAQPAPSAFISYQIELVSLPGKDAGDLVIEAPPSAPEDAPAEPVPDPTPAPPKRTPPPPKPEPESEPAEEAPKPAESAPTEPARTQPRPSPSGGDAAAGGDSAEAINIRMEGLRRDYPAYYSNIVVQIKRCLRWSGAGSPETEIYFVIEADGSVSESRYVRRSGNPRFDIEALGAVECAGQPGRFGPLPEDLPLDRLQVRFTFRPGNVAGIFR